MSAPERITDLGRYIPALNSISDEKIRSDTAEIYLDLYNQSKWMNLSDQPIVNDVRVSGLEHVNAVIEMCVSVAKVLKNKHKVEVNLDYLISGSILHDAGKLVEYEPDGTGERRTKLGELGQHTLGCLSLILERKMPEEIMHMVVSHTNKSSTPPKTIEAVILYFVDSLDFNVLRIVHGLGSNIQKF